MRPFYIALFLAFLVSTAIAGGGGWEASLRIETPMSPPLWALLERELFDGELTWKEERISEPGWYNWSADLYLPELTDIYMWSMDRRDLKRFPKEGWIGFLEGKEPDYPEHLLRSALASLRESVEAMRLDLTTPDTRLADWALGLNPVRSHELNQLMLGGHLHGRFWIPHVRVRYCDPVVRRAGIPPDVAALVTAMGDDWADLILVNLNQVLTRELPLQTGAYGEHQCLSVEFEGSELIVEDRFFRVRQEPSAGGKLKIRMRRYVNQPTLALPWHG